MAGRENRCEDATGCVLDEPISERAVNLQSGEMIGRGGFLPLTETQKPISLKKAKAKPKSKSKGNKLKGKGTKAATVKKTTNKKTTKAKAPTKKPTKGKPSKSKKK